MKEVIYPPKLKKGAKIAIISPAGSVEEIQLEKGINFLKSKGFETVLGKNVFTKVFSGYSYAGTEEERISDINWALNDPEISAVWASRGGYGCMHLVRNIKLSGFKKTPKWYIGYSDNTVINSFLLKNNFASIHGQTIKTSSFGVIDDGYDRTFDILLGKKPKYSVKPHKCNKFGTAEGQLIGGNLALVYALLGTKYSYDFKDKILFIEDIGEQYYALDRMLMSLDLAGVFSKISGLIVGGMTNMGDEKSNKDFEESFDDFAYKIVAERIKNYDFPTIFGFPNGHIFDNRPLIIGADVRMKVGEKVTLDF